LSRGLEFRKQNSQAQRSALRAPRNDSALYESWQDFLIFVRERTSSTMMMGKLRITKLWPGCLVLPYFLSRADVNSVGVHPRHTVKNCLTVSVIGIIIDNNYEGAFPIEKFFRRLYG
jgi:hypothetical protein